MRHGPGSVGHAVLRLHHGATGLTHAQRVWHLQSRRVSFTKTNCQLNTVTAVYNFNWAPWQLSLF